MKSSSGV